MVVTFNARAFFEEIVPHVLKLMVPKQDLEKVWQVFAENKEAIAQIGSLIQGMPDDVLTAPIKFNWVRFLRCLEEPETDQSTRIRD